MGPWERRKGKQKIEKKNVGKVRGGNTGIMGEVFFLKLNTNVWSTFSEIGGRKENWSKNKMMHSWGEEEN